MKPSTFIECKIAHRPDSLRAVSVLYDNIKRHWHFLYPSSASLFSYMSHNVGSSDNAQLLTSCQCFVCDMSHMNFSPGSGTVMLLLGFFQLIKISEERWLLRRGWWMLGCSISKQMLNGSVLEMKPPKGSFEVVVCQRCLWPPLSILLVPFSRQAVPSSYNTDTLTEGDMQSIWPDPETRWKLHTVSQQLFIQPKRNVGHTWTIVLVCD